MSHIVTIRTQIRDPAALAAACGRLNLPPPLQGTTQLYSGSATGWQVQLPGWKYPAVIDVTSGQIAHDNFGGHWGEQKELDRLLQAYAVEKARIEARRNGHTVHEQLLPDGAIKLTISLASGVGAGTGGAL